MRRWTVQPCAVGGREWGVSRRIRGFDPMGARDNTLMAACARASAPWPAEQPIGRASDSQSAPVQNMGVDHCRAHVRAAQELLRRADVMTRFNPVRREVVPERMPRRPLRDPRPAHGVRDRLRHGRLVGVVPPLDAATRIDRQFRRREDVLPAEFGRGFRPLAVQGGPGPHALPSAQSGRRGRPLPEEKSSLLTTLSDYRSSRLCVRPVARGRPRWGGYWAEASGRDERCGISTRKPLKVAETAAVLPNPGPMLRYSWFE
jgi:hypothetical protein